MVPFPDTRFLLAVVEKFPQSTDDNSINSRIGANKASSSGHLFNLPQLKAQKGTQSPQKNPQSSQDGV